MASSTSKVTQNPTQPRLSMDYIEDKCMYSLLKDGALDQFFSQFESNSSNKARVKLVYQHLLRLRLMPQKPQKLQNTKSDHLSTESKIEGNKRYVDKKDREALDFYNKAVKYAKSSEMISVAFGNRSAVLYRLKKYRESLLDIGRAIDAGYCERLKPKLLLRKKQCEEAIELIRATEVTVKNEKEKMRKELFQLPEKRMTGVPCASASLEISYYASMGRGVKATEDIQPGQVLVVEDPYVMFMKVENYNDRCFFCCSRNFAMIACKTCTHVMYCNEECRTESWNLGHKFECYIMSHLVHMGFHDLFLASLQILLRAKSQYSSWDEMFKTIESIEKETDPKLKGFTLNSDKVLTYDNKNYAPIHMLEAFMEKRERDFLISACLKSAVLLYMLKEYTPIFADSQIMEDKYVWRVGGLLLHHSMSTAINNFGICSYVKNFQDLLINGNEFARGIYAFSSLFNHSCASNSEHVYHGTTMTILAQSFIKKGQQIYIAYGSMYEEMGMLSRQHELEYGYLFKCKCEACVNNWPLFINLKEANCISKNDKLFYSILRGLNNGNSMANLLINDKGYDLHLIKQFYKYIMMLEESAPCRELVLFQNFITMFWRLSGHFDDS